MYYLTFVLISFCLFFFLFVSIFIPINSCLYFQPTFYRSKDGLCRLSNIINHSNEIFLFFLISVFFFNFYFMTDTMTSDEVDLIWRDPDPTVLTNTAIRQGKGEINSANPGACMWQAFQSMYSKIFSNKPYTELILINVSSLLNALSSFLKTMLY